MKAMQNILDEFIANSTPEQLRAELAKGNRPLLQTISDENLVCKPSVPVLPETVPATVSFYVGVFSVDEANREVWSNAAALAAQATEEQLALAA
jgi:hypothetical protein